MFSRRIAQQSVYFLFSKFSKQILLIETKATLIFALQEQLPKLSTSFKVRTQNRVLKAHQKN